MKTILIEQVANGWIVRDQDVCSISYKPGNIRVYRNVKELQADLPNLLCDDQGQAAPTPEEIREARRKVIDEKFPPSPPKHVPGVGTATHNPDGSVRF